MFYHVIKSCFRKPNPLVPPCWKYSELVMEIWSSDRERAEHWETEGDKNDDGVSRAYLRWNSSVVYSSPDDRPPFVILTVRGQAGMEITCSGATRYVCQCCPLLSNTYYYLLTRWLPVWVILTSFLSPVNRCVHTLTVTSTYTDTYTALTSAAFGYESYTCASPLCVCMFEMKCD